MHSYCSFLRRPVFSNFIRSYRGRQTRAQTANPGIRNRLKLFANEAHNIDTIGIDEETLDSMESDFMNARQINERHKKEIFKMRKNIDLFVTERKYFGKGKNPNMLTWSEKEQIRQLYETDPDVWTFEKLSQSFPASEDIVKKIIKSRWRFRNPADIKKHDQAVAANWKKLKEGTLDVDEPLRNHLSSFSLRDNLLKFSDEDKKVENKKMITAPQKEGEFAKIITSYKEQIAKKDGNLENKPKPLQLNPEKKPFVHIPNSSSGWAYKTLAELRKEVSLKSESRGYFSNEHEKHFLKDNSETISKFSVVPEDNIELLQKDPVNKKTSVPVTQNFIPDTEANLVLPDEILLKIRIPKKLRRKGSLFKKVDCFYDSQGKFLYRVPGMIS